MTTYLVTGAYGFLGSHFVKALLKDPSIHIVAVDRLQKCASLHHFDGLDTQNMHMVKIELGSSTTPDRLLETMEHFNVTHVVHFAAETHVDKSFREPLTFTHANILGTHHLLEAARRYVQKGNVLQSYLHMSTDEVYGEIAEGSVSEEALPNPTNPYAASKLAAEQLSKTYHISYNLPITIVRGNNIYGPGQYPWAVIPIFARNIKSNIPLSLHGSGSSIRTFIHVEDMVHGIQMVLQKGTPGETYNIGSHDETSIRDLAETMVSISGSNVPIVCSENRVYNDCRYSIHTQKIRRLGWSEQIPFLSGLKDTVQWYSVTPDSFWIHE
jgi:UDP-glucose 4,6-dehydratase